MSRFYCNNGTWTDGSKPVKTAPIQPTRSYNGGDQIPYPVAEEAYKEYAAQYGTSQTLERLNERGGFAWAELAHLLYERCLRLSHPAPPTGS